MRYLSVCSGIEAASVAWKGLGWKASAFSEIEPFPRAVLQHRYPEVPLHGDFTTIEKDEYGAIDLLVGGTPCQAFSVAGLRKGYSDERGNLTLEFIRLAKRKSPRWLVWENVPGVLSQDRGRAFGAFLGGLAECGYGFAYRVLDAQYFGVPQRRRRVFVVGYLGDWRNGAAVLFEQESLQRDITPRREAGERVADSLTVGANQYSGFCGEPVTAKTLMARHNKQDPELETYVATLGHSKQNGLEVSKTHTANTLEATGSCNQAVAIPINSMTMLGRPSDDEAPRMGSGIGKSGEPSNTLSKAHHHAVFYGTSVRRLTPMECERLQGFSDDYTLIPKSSDAARYKALGNSMAVPVMKWLGERIQMVEQQRTKG